MEKPVWGASWLLPEKFTVAWGARGIADKTPNSSHTHTVSLLGDRQGAVGDMEQWEELKGWMKKNLLPISLDYDGRSIAIEMIDDGNFHARYTPNGSYGYVYIIAWKEDKNANR